MTSRFIAEYQRARTHHAKINAEQRALVLRYPDLAARLCDPPYSASRPENWTGYIPGPLASENSRGVVTLNTSPVRAQLLAVLDEAAHRADDATQPQPATTGAQP